MPLSSPDCCLESVCIVSGFQRSSSSLSDAVLKKATHFTHNLESLSLEPVNLASDLFPDNGFIISVSQCDSLRVGVTGEHYGLEQHELAVVSNNVEPSILVRGVVQSSKKDSGNGRRQCDPQKRFEAD